MRKIAIIILVSLISSLFFSCGSGFELPDNSKPVVMTTLFPQYDFARQIAGELVNVVMLLPPGTESHMYDPSPADLKKITGADLFLYTGAFMEPWAAKVTAGADELRVVDLSEGISMIESEDEHAHEDENEGEEHQFDPHIWLSPENARLMVGKIADAFCEIDSVNSDVFKANAEAYILKLNEMEDNYKQLFESSKRDVIVFGGRFAFIYFTDYYDIKFESVFHSCSTQAEPTAGDMYHITEFIKNNSIPVILHEELTDPKIARAISEETGAELAEFSTAHNVTKSQFKNGITFLDIMNSNYENLKTALN